jgi:serine/threonine protein kinase/tetratricopeptide (TPR) repeat protein
MNAQAAPHPNDRLLRDYGLGKLDDVSAESVNTHLAACPACRQRVAALSSDSFLGRLRDARVRPESPAPDVSATKGLSRLDGGQAHGPAPPASDLPPGLVNHPDYEILRELGQGGMGTVFLARNILMGRLEVLKVASEHLLNRPGVMERFLGEVRNAAKLQHPNVVTAYSAIRVGDSLVLAMQYVDGLDLSRLVKARGPLPVANACNYIHQAALGLQHAHERGMVHRDIKPSNLMLTRQGNRAVIKVLDFGLAKITSESPADRSLTHEGQMLGTPDFIAPEQIIDARRADIRADIYSLGCTFYYLLAGRPPFEGVSLYDILQAHHSVDALPVNLARPEASVALAALVAKMMAKEPERRFQRPSEVALALLPFFKSASSGSKESNSEGARTGRGAVKPQFFRAVSSPVAPEEPGQSAPSSNAETPPPPARPELTWRSSIGTREMGLPSVSVRSKRRRTWVFRSAIILASFFGAAAVGALVYVAANRGRANFVVANPGEQSRVEFEHDGLGKDKPKGLNRTDTAKNLKEARPRLKVAASSTSRQAQIYNGTWRVEGEDLVQASAEQGGKSMVFGDPSWSDYDFEVEVKGIGGTNVWIFFDYVDPSNHCNFYPGPGNDHGLGTVVDGHVTHKSVRGSLQPDRWYKVKIEVRGPEARCFLEGEKVLDHFEARLTKGKVGLGGWETVSHFRNIEVRSTTGEILWQGLPELPRQVELDQAVERDPANPKVYLARAEEYLRRSWWKEAANDLARATELDPGDTVLPIHLGRVRLFRGDHEGYRSLCEKKAQELARLPFDMGTANNAVWLFCLGPRAVTEYTSVVKLGERAVLESRSPAERSNPLNTLGTVLFRAGRNEEAIDRFNERIAIDKSSIGPWDWAFLAMAHHQLGHSAEANRWLGKFRAAKIPDLATANDVWNNLELMLFSREVDALWRQQAQSEPLTSTPQIPAAGPARRARYVSGGSWVVEGDQLVKHGLGDGWVGFGDVKWTDYDLTYEAQKIAGPDGFGGSFREGGGKAYTVVIGGLNNNHCVCRWTASTGEGRSFDWHAGTIQPLEWNTVKISLRGQRIRIELNGSLLFSWTDDFNPHGYVALRFYNSSGRFRNIKITDPDGAILWAGPPDLR